MRFIHLADVHLGAVPDRGFPWSARREEEIWDTFRRIFAVIREDPVDLLFIAGDLFHRQPLYGELKEVAALFASIPETRIYLMAGNHDYLQKGSFYREVSWPGNVCFFSDEEPVRVKDPKLPVYVYGLSYEHQEIRESLYDEIAPWSDDMQEDAFHILLAHGGDETHIPMNVRELSAAGFDYLALGHIHRPGILITDRAAYAGALEPIDRNDIGKHGYMLGWTERGRLRTRFVSFASRSYLPLVVETGPEDTHTELEERIRERIHALGSGNIYRITLQGERSTDTVFLPERLKRLGNVIEIRDESRVRMDLKELYRRYRGTIIGDYIHSFGEEEDLSDTERKALFYGLGALFKTARFGEET